MPEVDLRDCADIIRRTRELGKRVAAMEEYVERLVEDVMGLSSAVSDIRKNDYELREGLARMLKDQENRVVNRILAPMTKMTESIAKLTQPRFGGGGE